MNLEKIESAEDTTSRTGLFRLPEDQYHAATALGHSALCQYARSPQHFKAYLESHRTTKSMEFGSALHCAIFEPDIFDERYCENPFKDRRTKAYKEWYNEEKRIVLNKDDIESIYAMHMAAQLNPTLTKYMQNGISEVAAFAMDPVSGFQLKARLDYYHPDKLIIVDLKTTSKPANSRRFTNSMIDYNYIVQAAYYTYILKLITKKDHKYVIIALETEKPHGMVGYILDQDTIRLGTVKFTRYLKLHKQAIDAPETRGYEPLKVYRAPKWAFDDEDIDLSNPSLQT